MTRSNAREIVAHLIFEMNFTDDTADQIVNAAMEPEYYESLAQETEIYAERPNQKQMEYIRAAVAGIQEKQEELDGYISKYAKGWKFSRIDRVAAAIMRVTMFEILYMPEVPNKVAINEAVEIAKKYLDEDVVKFVNGILGSFVREEFPEE